MATRSSKSNQAGKSTFTLSLILGLLLIPLSAVAAAALISSDDGSTSTTIQAEPIVEEAPETTVTTAETVEAETVFVTEAPSATSADLEAACGPDALELVEREADGTITELEQAALDALRQICLDEGFEVPGPPAPAPVVRTVTVVNPAPPATTASASESETASGSVGDEQYEDDDDESDDDESDDHEDEDHDDEDGEDHPGDDD